MYNRSSVRGLRQHQLINPNFLMYRPTSLFVGMSFDLLCGAGVTFHRAEAEETMRPFIGPGLAMAVQLVSIATLAAPVDVSGVIDQILPEDTSKAVGLVTLTNPNVAAITISKFVPTLPNVVLPDSTDNVTDLFIVAGGSCPAIPFVLGPVREIAAPR
jgi:hypothetical protein